MDPSEETLAVYRWHADGFVEVRLAERRERVRAEPLEAVEDAVEIDVGVLFGHDDE